METARNCIQRQEELVGGRGAGVGLLQAADPGAPLASEPAARHQPCTAQLGPSPAVNQHGHRRHHRGRPQRPGPPQPRPLPLSPAFFLPDI